MAIDETTRELISLKKLSGKAHTSNDKGLPNEAKPSGLTLSSNTVFGEPIPGIPTKTLYNISGGTVEYLRLSASFIQGADTASGRHGFELKLPDDYQAQSSNPLKGTYPFINGQSIQITSGALQLVPASFGVNYEAKPYHSASGVQTVIPVLDARDWYLDYFNGIFFQQDPPGTGDDAQNPRYVDAFLYIGNFLDKVVSNTGGGDPGAQYVVLASTGSLTNERVLNAGSGLTLTDGGAGGAVTFGLDDDIVATISGSTFTGVSKFNAGLSGSLTQLTDGKSYIVAGAGISIASASNGQITITGNVGDVTAVNVSSGLTGGGNTGDITIGLNDNLIATVTGSNTFVPVQKFNAGLSGSLTQLTSGASYLVAGSNVTIASASNGQVTISSTDTNTEYTAGNGLDLTGNAFSLDLKAGSGLVIDSTELSINDGVIATISGSTFSGTVTAPALSGSLTKLSDGKSYLVAGPGISIASASNGQVTITGNVGDITGVAAGSGLTGGGTSGDVTLTINDNLIATVTGSNTFVPVQKFNAGLSGSITQLTNGTSYMVAGPNVAIASQSNGQITISSTDTNTEYTAGAGLNLGGTQFSVDTTEVAMRSGTTFTGDVDFKQDIRVSGTLHVYELKSTLVSSSIIFKSGSTKFGDTADDLHAFTGSVQFLNPAQAFAGLSGSLTQLTDGRSYLAAGNNVTITSQSNGQIIIAAANTTFSAGDGLDLSGTTFSVDLKASSGLKIDSTELAVEPADFAGTGLEDDGSDNLRIAASAAGTGLKGGAGSALSINDGVVATLTGSVFTGTVSAPALSGSLTKTQSGLSYLVAGSNITIATGSNGQITIGSTASGGSLTAVSGSTSVSDVDNIDYGNIALVQNLGGGNIALTGTIGNAEDGNYSDGLYTDFTSLTTVGTAVDRFNEVLKALAPPPAPSLDDMDVNVDGTDVTLSFGSSNDQSSASPAYASVAASAGIGAAVDVNGVYQTATSGNNLRAAVFQGSTDIIGNLNEDVAIDQQGSETNYPANSFGDADDGVLRLEVNGVTIHEIDLTTSVGTGSPGSGSGTHVNGNGSGFTSLSNDSNGTFENGNTFASFKHRTGNYKVATGDQRRGWNYARVLHVRSGSTVTTNYVEWVNDDNSDALAAAGNSITFSGGPTTTIKLSGVEYFQSASLDYKVRVSNAYKYVYDTNQITFGASTGGSSNSGTSFTLANQAKPSINTGAGEDHTKVLHLTASSDLTADYMIGGTATANVNVTHPLKSNISSGGSTTVSGILMYNLPDTSTATSETFQRETYRLQSGSFDAQSDVTGGSLDWDSSIHMSGSGGHADGLQFIEGDLRAPTLDFRMANGPSPSNPDYTTLPSGLRTLYRKYKNTTGRAVNNLSFTTFSNLTTTLVGAGDSVGANNRVRVLFKHPGKTEWLDAKTAFSYHDTSNRAGGAAPESGASDVTLQGATNYVTFGTSSIPNNEWVVMKIEADDEWTSELASFSVAFGAEGAINVAPDLSQIDCNNVGTDASLSFGATLGLTGYSNVTTAAGFSAVNANGDFDLSGNRRGVFNGATDLSGELNEQVGASGNNYPANAFGGGNAHTGTLKLEVNGSVIHTFDLNNNFAANSDTSGASGSGFNLSAASVSRDTNQIPEWTRFYRTGAWTVKASDQRKGHNYARVIHEVTGASETSTYAEWVNDTDGAAAGVTLTGHTITNFRSATTYSLSGIKYFISPKADFVVTGSGVYKFVHSENNNAIQFLSLNNAAVASVHVSGSGIVNGHVIGTELALPNLDTSVAEAYNKKIFITGTLNFSQASSIPGGSSYTMSAAGRVHHPLHGNTTSSTATSPTLLVFTDTDDSTQLSESFNGEAKRLQSGSYDLQANVTAGGSAWSSTTSMNGADAGHNTGLAVYNGKLVAPANTGNSGDFRNTADGGSLASPDGNPNYSNVTNATRHYTRWFQNTTGGSKTDFAITINGAGTIVQAGTSLASNNNFRVHAKIPRTSSGFETGWMDLAKAFETGENGDNAGCLVGSLDSSLNATNNATFGTQSVGANEYIVVRIVADKTWTGNIESITIAWS